MKFCALDTTVYRACAPRYLATAGSWAGSMVEPGRFNPAGLPTLYTALEPETAYQEYQQNEGLARPTLIVSIRVRLSKVVDFRDGFNDEWSSPWRSALEESWRLEVADSKAQGREALVAGWKCATEVITKQAVGVLYPSKMAALAKRAGTNLAIYPLQYVFGVDSQMDLDPRKDVEKAIETLQRSSHFITT